LGWEARWTDPETGKERSKLFRREAEAKRHGARMEAAKAEGRYIDPAAGNVTVTVHAEAWRQRQLHRPRTAREVERQLRRYVYPHIGERPLSSLRRSDIEFLVKGWSASLAPDTVRVLFGWVRTIFRAAVADRLIISSPCDGVRLSSVQPPPVVPLEPATVAALVETIDPRYRALILLGAGSGIRISEALGLTVDRVDFLRRHITINRQLVRGGKRGGKATFGPVKDQRNRPRTIPVGQVVLDALAEHLAIYGTGPEGLLFSTVYGSAVGHSTWGKIWRTAADPLGIAKGEGFHQLRHFYASTLIAAGCSVKEVQERLGHTSAAMTLDVYSHLWPSDDDRTRTVTDEVLSMLIEPSDGREMGAEEG
jgi:integrase